MDVSVQGQRSQAGRHVCAHARPNVEVETADGVIESVQIEQTFCCHPDDHRIGDLIVVLQSDDCGIVCAGCVANFQGTGNRGSCGFIELQSAVLDGGGSGIGVGSAARERQRITADFDQTAQAANDSADVGRLECINRQVKSAVVNIAGEIESGDGSKRNDGAC